MANRETYKDIQIGGRAWRINKFDALTGSYVVYTLLTQVLPMGMESKVSGLAEQSNDRASLPVMNKETFISLMQDCLKVCSEIKMVNNIVAPVSVLMADGRFGVADLEHDTVTVMLLTVQTLGYNVSDFFSENALDEIKKSFSELNLSNVSI